MNILKIIRSLQAINTSGSTHYDVMLLAKIIEKLKVGNIFTVASTSNLPTNLTENGFLYYVMNEQQHFYNIGPSWAPLSGLVDLAYTWGYNGYGRLGDGTTTNRSSPTFTTFGGSLNWSQVSGGSRHSLGITSAGIAYGWGRNSYGRLGDGTTTNRSSPVTVIGGITNWSQLSAGGQHSLGITATGIAYAWGRNNYGQIGAGTNTGNTGKSSPVTVIGGITNWSQLAAGYSHSLGLTATGIAYGWGTNGNGRVGDGTTTARSSPVTVVGGITNWSQLAAGSQHSLGATATGIAYGWGYNGSFRLGDGTNTARSSPVTVAGGITNWSQLAAGYQHSLGITSTGIAYGWGENNQGRLGDNNNGLTRISPQPVVGGITNWSQIAAGGRHSLGLTSTGIAYGWGDNGYGQIGNGTTNQYSSPVTVVGGITNWSQISVGANHSLGIQSIDPNT